jgi:hypothetical protein
MNRAERRAAMGGPTPNACRRVDGVFKDGKFRYAWTLPDGSGLYHDHRDGLCPFGPGGKHENRAEVLALANAHKGCAAAGCGECGPMATFESLFGFTEEQADAVFTWVEADDNTPEFGNAVERLTALNVDAERALEIIAAMVEKGLVVTLCVDCEQNHKHELPYGARWIHRATHDAA